LNHEKPMPDPGASPPVIEMKIKWSGTLIAAGLLVQLASLTKIHPLSFVAFLLIGCPLVAAGIIVYLVSLVSDTHPS